MKIEIKNIKHSEFASEETNCFEATLYIDGKKIGRVSNQGHGGPDHFIGDDAKYREANEWCKANLPKWTMSHDETDTKEYDTDLEMHTGELLTSWLLTRDMRKTMRSKVLFQMPDEQGIQVMAFKYGRKIDQRHIDHVKAKYPSATILNEMPENEALKLYKTA